MEQLAITIGIRAFVGVLAVVCVLCVVALAAEPCGEDE